MVRRAPALSNWSSKLKSIPKYGDHDGESNGKDDINTELTEWHMSGRNYCDIGLYRDSSLHTNIKHPPTHARVQRRLRNRTWGVTAVNLDVCSGHLNKMSLFLIRASLKSGSTYIIRLKTSILNRKFHTSVGTN